MKYQYLFLSAFALANPAIAFGHHRYRHATPHNKHRRATSRRDVDPTEYPQFPAYNISMPLDHFKNDSRYAPHSDAFYNARYWFDASFYKTGGPVIVLNSGEEAGDYRLPYLEKGILHILAEATGGIAVLLEHRFYGLSYPLDLQHVNSTTLRFVSTEQAMADMAYFARNIVFPGFEHMNLTAPAGTPFIAYGASYGGSVVAFTRMIYPDLYWGAISSSAVTHAQWDFWQYYEAARYFAPRGCAEATIKLTDVVDNILIGKKGTEFPQLMRDLYGLGNLTADVDFAAVLHFGITWMQSTNWDPDWDAPSFYYYCNNITARTLQFPELANFTHDVQRLVEAGGYASDAGLVTSMLNQMGYVRAESVARWAAMKANYTQDEYFSGLDTSRYRDDSLNSLEDRVWAWQYCTEWGLIQPGSTVPADMRPLVSRLITIEYETTQCRAFFNRTQEADVTIVNKYGGFDISFPRLALICGSADPWRQVNPLALGRPLRNSTTDQPWILMEGGVHNWDENGATASETNATYPPPFVQSTQAQEKEFVKAWLVEYAAKKGSGMD